eukprot:TRINITY_DN7256_c0_g1_i1.p1 TRINITY_DN7256_c0_g1~~TRINITY_DN7256_c0_g1_i1.p1  ORF type:complete len:322 (+),score=101.49 TRINITY_DN7256_c0_g1_i1:2-967(+)
MSRHSKNNTASAVFTYHEKKQLAGVYGTKTQRLAGVSLHQFDSCRLCLQPVIDPMSCPHGHLFCRECIFKYLLKTKKALKMQHELYERQQLAISQEQSIKEELKKERQIEQFEKSMSGILPIQKSSKNCPEDDTRVTNLLLMPSSSSSDAKIEDKGVALTLFKKNLQVEQEAKKAAETLPSFWVPSLTPDSKPELIKKPTKTCVCPEDSSPLRAKDLIKVIFRSVEGIDEKDPNKVLNSRYECAVCHKTFTDSSKATWIQKCGLVCCTDWVENFVKTEKGCLVCSKPFSSKHLIKLQNGGTGYSGSGHKLQAEKFTSSGRF